MLEISQLYEKIIGCVCLSDENFKIYLIALLVLSRDAHSLQLYLVYTFDELKQMIVKLTAKDEIVIGNVVIMLCCIQMMLYFLQTL
mgnify:CR=1 FL=1